MSDLIRREDAKWSLHQQLLYRMNSEGMKERLDMWIDSIPGLDIGFCQSCRWNLDHTIGEGTRCPIEEHYALPKDGYCYLYKKYEEEG